MVYEEGPDGKWKRPDPSRILSEEKGLREGVEGDDKAKGAEMDGGETETKIRPARFYILRDPWVGMPETFMRTGTPNRSILDRDAAPMPVEEFLRESRKHGFDYPFNERFFESISDPFRGMGMGAYGPFGFGFGGFGHPFFGPSPFFGGWGPFGPLGHFPPRERRRLMGFEDGEDERRVRVYDSKTDKDEDLHHTELDAYRHRDATSTPGEKRLVGTSASQVSYMGEDGVMHTKYALKKHYSDGTTEVVERSHTDDGSQHNGPFKRLLEGDGRLRDWAKILEKDGGEVLRKGEDVWNKAWEKGKELVEELTGGKEGGPGTGR